MIHLAHTTLDLPAVVGTVWLPIQACGTPYRPSISLANKGVFAIEVLQARCWFSRSRLKGISAARNHIALDSLGRNRTLCLPIVSTVLSLFSCPALSLCVPLLPSWDISGVICDGVQKAKVGDGNEYEEDGVQDEDCSGCTMAWGLEGAWRLQEIVHCCFGQLIPYCSSDGVLQPHMSTMTT